MLISYAAGAFPEDYVPVCFDNYRANLTLDGKQLQLDLWDCSGQEERVRPLMYYNPPVDVVLCAFSVVDPLSMERVRGKWCPEVAKHCPKAALVLVGTKVDLREDLRTVEELVGKGLGPVYYEEGVKVVQEIGAVRYMECSALTHFGVGDVFEEAVRAVWAKQQNTDKESSRECVFL
uniref:Uncharacterized protein n=1 Tax=Arcella intermedia TaxID=1963864 RepID=A0A6B2LKY5_9EUKA